jgi:HAE1 family hydrophobic/amphiphilic exporter-1
LGRTDASLAEASRIAKAIPGVQDVIAISGISVLDNNSSLANAGAAYVILDDWGVRLKKKGQDLRSIYETMSRDLTKLTDGSAFVVVPPAIQGIGNAGGFTLQIEQRDGTFDYAKLQDATDAVVKNGNDQSGLQRLFTSFRAAAPHLDILVDRTKAETLKVSVGAVFDALSSYLGSTYVNQFNKFGLAFQVYAQADAKYRLRPEDVLNLQVRNLEGNMVPIGAIAQVKPSVGPSLISLYNLYLSSTVSGGPAPGFSSGQAMDLMQQISTSTLPQGSASEWTAMSYQEAVVGNQLLYTFGLAILLVYLCLAGQYESWVMPLAVIAAVPLSLLGPGLVIGFLGLANNLYTQIGLMLLIALSAKNAILIVEVARELRLLHHKSIVESAIEAARTRFRPIIMTSFAFILGVMPLVFASGAGANSRISLGICVASGMLASTCLAVLFVPSFFAVLQRFCERGAPLPTAPPAAATAK